MANGLPKLIACESGKALAEKIADQLTLICRKKFESLSQKRKASLDNHLDNYFEALEFRKLRHILEVDKGIRVCRINTKNFDNGEFNPIIEESIRGFDVYLVSQIYDPCANRSINDNFIQAMLLGDAIVGASAERLTGIFPYEFMGRQDEKRGREPIGTRLSAKIIEATGFDHLIKVESHCAKTAGCFNIPVENLHPYNLLLDYMKKVGDNPLEFTYCSPDAGGAARANKIRKLAKSPYAICTGTKVRDYTKKSAIDELKISGDVSEKVAIVDDIISTGGTIEACVNALHEKGARQIIIVTAHPEFSGNAKERMRKLYDQNKLKYVLSTDSIIHPEVSIPWFKQVSLARMLARVIYRMNNEHSVAHVFDDPDYGNNLPITEFESADT